MSEVGGQIVRYLKVSHNRQRLEIRDLGWCIPRIGATATLLCDEIHTGTFLVVQQFLFDGGSLRQEATSCDVRTRRHQAEQFRLRSSFWSCAVSSWSWSELVFVSPCSLALFDTTEH
jgi:hypothetical protein